MNNLKRGTADIWAVLLVLGVMAFLGGCVTPGLDKPAGDEFQFHTSPSPETFEDLEQIQPVAETSLGSDTRDWYRDAVFYHIWVNAFNDSDGDGVGDIPGITEKLDYLADLGVTALWLSPFFESASEAINLHMYDTTDHYRVDPRFGTLADVDHLLAQAHDRGIRVIFDFVPNHVSNKHPWFQDSAKGRDGKDGWFVWHDTSQAGSGPWGQQVLHEYAAGSYYYGVFWSGMPDINYRNQAAKDAMTNVAIFWLNRGFDGMRVDAVKYLYEDPGMIRGGYEDQAETFRYYQALRSQILDAYSSHTDGQGRPLHKMMVAENWTSDRSSLESYMVKDQKTAFHMTLDFPSAYALNDRNIAMINSHFSWAVESLNPEARMGTFLSNHDNVVIRPGSRHSVQMVRAVTAAQLLGVGTPFIYYGNEVGQADADQYAGQSHEDRRHRQPLEWSLVADQEADPASLLNLVRELTALRSERESLRRGDWQVVSTAGSVLMVRRTSSADSTLVVISLASVSRKLSVGSDTLGFSPQDSQILLTDRAGIEMSSPETVDMDLQPGGILVLGF
ncbi:alpha-amylase family glycosyl hydrolase [Spirochaeta lutea]|uniref:Glycosyl hydrolase family 13 catalytic domain-containing protein n=1 Tax=Spirochaeta lutea TaxID=1480694 RepID=A0A098QY97_9SPIO|nr:alpha-amylase family glycosyl hydrolase [Spirochaeta lutea]KGE72815.1 hypothetical protein DC28_05405 [Spirochaeta lutea]